MNRREFLSLSLLGLGSLLMPSQVQAMTTDGSLKPSAGRILGLDADGMHWEVLTDLGPENTVEAIYQDRDSYLARVNFRGHIFHLKSTDGRAWCTQEWVAPSTTQSRAQLQGKWDV